MAKRMIQKGSEEWQFFQDFYKFRMAFYDGEENDQFWDDMIRESDRLVKKYEKTDIVDFAKKLVLAHLEDVEKRAMK